MREDGGDLGQRDAEERRSHAFGDGAQVVMGRGAVVDAADGLAPIFVVAGPAALEDQPAVVLDQDGRASSAQITK